MFATRLPAALAVSIALAAAFAVFTPLAWLIHNRDWGIALMPLVPLLVWAMMRLWRRLVG